jgi:acyl-CoA synthetase (AMP-forming)/AMP-acid ligase II/thioesterase domain-containing protein
MISPSRAIFGTTASSVDNAGVHHSTVGGEIRRRAELQPEHTAVVASGFAPLSYRELQCLIDDVHAALRLAGFGRSARIAIAMRNGPQAALAIVAVACSAVSIPLNPGQPLNEIETCLAVLLPDAVLVVEDADSSVRSAAEHKGIRIIEATQLKYGSLGFSIAELQTVTAAALDETGEPVPDAPAFILQTSGTAAKPKLISVSHRITLAAAEREQCCYEITPLDRCLSVTPIWYAYGLLLPVLAPLLSGGSVAFPVNPLEIDLSEWLSALMPTWYSAGPTLHRSILEQLESQAGAKVMHSLRFVLTGGASLPQEVHEGLQSMLGVPVLDRYGASETQLISTNRPPPGPSKSGTCGIPWPDTVIIIGKDGRRLAPGQQGEILVSGATVISGYLDAPELNRVSFIDEWYKTGDIGSFDEDGFLTHHGRKNDLINRGGEKVAPLDVETAVLLHPEVQEAAAFGVPHPRLGENVAVAVVLRPGAVATAIDLRNFVRVRLPAAKVPQRIDIVEALPKGNTGKVLRSQLAEAASHRKLWIDPPEQPLEFQILEIWQRLLKRADIGVEDNFFEAGGDSLLATKMLLEVEAIMGRRVSQSALAQASTIRELAAIAVADVGVDDELVTKAREGAGTPFFFCHGDIDTRGFYALRLTALLDPDQPVYLIHPRRDVDEKSELVIEDMAHLYLPRLLSAHPRGIFRLGGYCNGGLLAWEIAHQLRQAGRDVESVVLIDSLSLNSRLLFRGLHRLLHGLAAITWGKDLERRLRRGGMPVVWYRAQQSAGSKYRWIAQAIQSLCRRLARGNRAAKSFKSQYETHMDLYFRAMANYIPPMLDCEIIAIVCERSANVFECSTEPWTRLARDVHHTIVPGDHLTCITTYVEALAQSLNVHRLNHEQ